MNEEIIQNLNQRLDDALDKGRKIVEDEEFGRRVDELKLRTEHLVRRHPIKSVATGLLVGYLVGRILSDD